MGLLLMFCAPYVDPKVDALAWVTQTATLLTLLGAAALLESRKPQCDCAGFRNTLSLLLPVINLAPLVVITYLISSALADMRRSAVRNRPPPAPAVLRDEAPDGDSGGRKKNLAPRHRQRLRLR